MERHNLSDATGLRATRRLRGRRHRNGRLPEATQPYLIKEYLDHRMTTESVFEKLGFPMDEASWATRASVALEQGALPKREKVIRNKLEEVTNQKDPLPIEEILRLVGLIRRAKDQLFAQFDVLKVFVILPQYEDPYQRTLPFRVGEVRVVLRQTKSRGGGAQGPLLKAFVVLPDTKNHYQRRDKRKKEDEMASTNH